MDTTDTPKGALSVLLTRLRMGQGPRLRGGKCLAPGLCACLGLGIVMTTLPSCRIISGSSGLTGCLNPTECEAQACPNPAASISQHNETHQVTFTASDAHSAQAFTYASATKLSFFTIKLVKVGAPTGNLTAEIRADCSGSPCDSALQTSLTEQDASQVSTSGSTVSFSFFPPVVLTADASYWFVLNIPLSGQGGADIRPVVASGNPYAGGEYKYAAMGSSTWFTTHSTYDQYMEIGTCQE